MKGRMLSFLFVMAVVAGGLLLALRFRPSERPAPAHEYPVEGLVIQDDGRHVFEAVPKQDRQMLRDLGFPQALVQHSVDKVRHLVIHLDCHYFFLADGRVLVMSVSGTGPSPWLVETKRWEGAPHDFRDYRNDLLPST